MVPATLALTASGGTLVGSDGAFEVDVPAGAVTASDLTASGGSMSLLVRQVLPASGGSAGGSGIVTYGLYLIQVLDAKGQLTSRSLHSPLTVKLHVAVLDPTRTLLVLNQALPTWFDATPISVPTTPASGARTQAPAVKTSPKPLQPALGKHSSARATVGPGGSSLSGPVTLSGPNTSVSWDSTVPVGAFGRPDPFEPGLSSGSLTAGYPIDIPAGPGGLTPPVELGYSSAAVNDQHNPQAAAPWVGEGWNLSLGEISWAEHQVYPPSTCTGTCPTWDDTWQLSDPFGTSAELIPPRMDTTTFLHDGPWPQTITPITDWHTSPETHAKVIAFTAPFGMPGNPGETPDCFRVFLPNGIMEEFGCVANALQYFPDPSGANAGKPYMASWLLDMITDPQGNQVHITYQADAVSTQTMVYPRDVELATVEYDSPGCLSASTMCTTSWNPLVRVNFAASYAVAHLNGAACSGGGTPRCDDPIDLSGSNPPGLGVPEVQNTLVLNDIQVQVRPNSSMSWNTLRDYQLGYAQSGPRPIVDPLTGLNQSTAGSLDLTKIQEVGADGATSASMPATTYTYTVLAEVYQDSASNATPSANCGYSTYWNTSACWLWSQSWDGGDQYLAEVDNGLGLQEKFSWELARSNASASNLTDPLYCNSHVTDPACAAPDNEAWSRVVLASKTDSVKRPASTGNTEVDSTWSYTYTLQPWTITCPDCGNNYQGQGMYWRSSEDTDQADFYNNKFVGFGQTLVSNPDGSADVHKYLSGAGLGVYDWLQVTCNTASGPPTNSHCASSPWWLLPNAGHGHEYELDEYDIPNGTTLLRQVKTRWNAVCPPVGVSGSAGHAGYGDQGNQRVSQLDQGTNPATVCDVQKVQTDTYQFDGSSTGTHSAVTYQYDQNGNVTSQTSVANASVADSSGHGVQAGISGGVTEQVPGLISGDSDTAMSLDGLTGSVETGYVQTGVTSYTVEAWVKTTDTGFRKAIVQDQGSGLGQSLTLGMYPATGAAGEPFFELEGNYLEIGIFGTTPINDGQPHHVVGTWSGTSGQPVTPAQFHLYVDGNLVTTTSTITNGSANAPLTGLGGTKIGHHDIWNTSFSGTIDEVALYTTVLSAARIAAHHSGGSGYKAAVLADSPAAYFRLDDGAAGPTGPNTIVSKPTYSTTDTVTATQTSAGGTYLMDLQSFSDIEDVSGNRYQCSTDAYSAAGQLTAQNHYTGCGTAPSFTTSGPIQTTFAYDSFGNRVASADADANAGNSIHLGCTVGSTNYSTCTTYDPTFGALPQQTTNARGQTATMGYQALVAPPSTIADISGHGGQATWSGGVGFGATGLVSGDTDTATSFDGNAAIVNLNVGGIDTTSGHQVTVEFWMNWNGGTTSHIPFGFNGYDLWLLPGTGFGFNTSNSDLFGVPMSAVPVGQPVHVVAVFTNGSVSSNQLYLNGVPQTLTQLKGSPLSKSVSAAATAGGFSTSGYGFNGVLDEVAVYNGAMSASQVSAHLGAGAGYKSAVLADSPIAYYRLDDDTGGASPFGGFGLWPVKQTDANGQTTTIGYDALGRETSRTLPGEPASGAPSQIADSSGHANPAAWSGGVGFGQPGLVSGDTDAALSFDGSGAIVNLNVGGIDTTSGHQVTVEFWMNWSGGTASHIPFGFNGYDLWLLPGTGFGFNTSNSDVFGVPMSAVPVGQPVHVVAVFTNGSVSSNQLYLNGVQQTLTQLTGSPLSKPVSAAATAGGFSTSGYGFNGALDEVAVYNGALSGSRVSAHFSAGAGYKAAVLADAPIAYYRFDDAGAGQATRTTAYTVWCAQTGPQTPCVEIDKTQRLNSTTTVTSRAFYDGLGHLVETRSPAPGGQDVVRFSYYDSSQRLIQQSVPYFVSAYTGPPGSAAFAVPDAESATKYTYDGTGRTLTTQDAFTFTTTKSYSAVCAPAGTGDPGCFEQTLTVDPKGHQGGVLVDGMGRTAYEQRYSGNSTSTYALYATAKYTYDFVCNLLKIVQPDGSTQTTFGYDLAGRKTSVTDPDLGPQTYTYDQDGNLTESVDARNGAGTIFLGYDGLDRPIWRNTTNSPTGAYDNYGYDSTAAGSSGVGRLTSETFSTGSLSGSYSYLYDGRGQQTQSTLTVGGTTPPAPAFVQQASNHASSVASLGATLGSNVTTGNRIVVVVGVWNNGAVANGVTDSAGNVYTKVAGQVASDGTEETVWTAPITAGGATKPTVTVTADSSADIGIAAMEYSGLSKASGTAAVDQTAMANGTTSGAGSVASGAATATAAGELAVGAYVDSGFGNTLSYGSGWSGRVNVSPASDMEVAAEDQAAGLGSTPNAQVGTGAGTTWSMSTVVFRSSAYTTQTSYDDAGNVLAQTYPDGQTVSNAYTAQGWLSGVSTAVNGTPSTLVSNVAYTGTGGAFGEITSASLGNGTYGYSAIYDPLDRATDLKTTKGSTVMFDQQRTFDGAGDVTLIAMTMPNATDNQTFCYDEQDRLTWAASTTTTNSPCGNNNTAGTLTAAQYSPQTFTYDVLGRLTSGPLGTYTYGDPAHVHAATAIGGTAWTSAYDAAGNMTCRAPSSSSTCAGTPTGAPLGYNNEGELQSWQNAPSSPSTTAQFLYDGQGQRVEQSVTQSGTTTTTVYVGDAEEVSTTGGTTTTTAYYYMDGKRIGLSVNGTISYLASDGLGTATVTLSSSGSPTAAQLFAPYGGVRYSSGTMPTPYGFTGQRSDTASGLDYYGARYYDPLAGQFTSGDTMLPGGGLDLLGLSRYAYVGGNPVIRDDPTGHFNQIVGSGGGQCNINDPSCGGGSDDGGGSGSSGGDSGDTGNAGGASGHGPCWMTGGVCVGGGTASAPSPEEVAAAEAQALYDANLRRANAIRTAQLLANDRASGADWYTLGADVAMALVFLSASGRPDQYCRDATCQAAMQQALGYVADLRSNLALFNTMNTLNSGGAFTGLSAAIFIGTPKGKIIIVPEGAVGPSRLPSGKGFQYEGGKGGNGLNKRVTGVRIMDPTKPGAKYSYPDGRVSYMNASGQTVNPYTGDTIPPTDPWAHLGL
jgi:RHS repeat-associated protein